MKGNGTKITALYCRLSQDDGNVGDSMSIQSQDGICQGVFLHKITISINSYDQRYGGTCSKHSF